MMLQLGFSVALALLQAASAVPAPITGTARSVDGDSLELRGSSIRLFGIDAPEFDQVCTRAGVPWACGVEAAQQLSKLVTGRSVSCVPVGYDQYQRVLARCSVLGTDVNLTMVQTGYATAYRRYSDDYVPAEGRAKAAKRGIWSGEFEMPSEVRAKSQPEPSALRGASRPGPARRQSDARSSGECLMKGNRSRRGEWIYHLPGMPYYDQTRPEDVFCSEREAQAAGYRRAIVR